MSGRPLSAIVVTALFLLALLPLLPDHVLFHPDERHYLDAGLQMVESGDWLTPRTCEGELRLQKPVLAYWCVAAGVAVFGPSPFSTRILFLLSAGAILWVASRTAKETLRAPAGTLTALLLALHPAVLISSTRAVPDILLGLGVTVSLYGFLTLIHRGQAAWGSLLAMALGGATAVVAKGAPGIAFLLYGSFYLLWRERTLVVSNRGRFLVALFVCLLISGGWYIEMSRRHGPALAAQFLTDQGSPYRFTEHPVQYAVQLLLCVAVLAGSFGALLVPALRTFWDRRSEAATILQQPVHEFLAGWVGLYLLAAASLNHVSLRYLLPIVPAAALLLSSLLIELESPVMRRNLRWLAWGCLSLPILAALLCGLFWWDSAPIASLVVLASALLVVRLLKRQMQFTGLLRAVSVAGIAGLTAILILTGAVASLVSPSFGRQMIAALQQNSSSAESRPSLLLVGENAHASRIRICAGGRWDVQHLSPHVASDLPLDQPIAILESAGVLHLTRPMKLIAIPCGLYEIQTGELLGELWRGRLVPFLRERRRAYVLAIPAESPATPENVPLPGTQFAHQSDESVVR